MLEELVLFAEKELAGKKINYTLTTNAVLLTDHIIEFFMQHHVDLLISLDGSKESHDKNRVFAATGKGKMCIRDSFISGPPCQNQIWRRKDPARILEAVKSVFARVL